MPYDYPKELFKDDTYRVALGPEEHFTLQEDGWSDKREKGVKYRPVTAPALGVAVMEEDEKPRGCSICGETGHNARTCPKKAA